MFAFSYVSINLISAKMEEYRAFHCVVGFSPNKVEEVFNAIYIGFNKICAVNDAIANVRFRSDVNDIITVWKGLKFCRIWALMKYSI